jgi:hypothetical protein
MEFTSSSSSLGGLKNATSGGRSPRGGHSPPHPPFPAHTVAPRAGMSPSHPLTNADGLTGVSQSLTSRVASPRHSPPHRGLQSPGPSTSSTRTPPGTVGRNVLCMGQNWERVSGPSDFPLSSSTSCPSCHQGSPPVGRH